MNNWMSDAVQVSRQADRPRQGADAGDAEAARRVGPLQGRRRRRHPVPHAARATACRRTSRAAPATTRRRSTASGRTTTSSNMDRLARKFETARTLVPQPVVDTTPRREDRHHRATARRTGRSARAAISCARKPSVETSYLRLRAYPFTDGARGVHRRARARLRRRAEPRRAAAAADEARARRRSGSAKLRSVLHYNGLPIDARSVTDDVLAQEGFEVAKKTVHVADAVGGGMTGGE